MLIKKFMIIGGFDRPFWHRVFLYFDGLEIVRTIHSMYGKVFSQYMVGNEELSILP